MIYLLSRCLGISGDSSRSNYTAIEIDGVGKTTIRVSNHSAKVSNFSARNNNTGIVIKTSNHRFRAEPNVDYVEFMYYGDKVAENAELQRRIVNGLRHYIETGSFEQMPEADRLNTSGVYRSAMEGMEEKAMYRDSDMSLEETITKMKTDAMQANADNLQAKRDAMRAIGGNLNHLRQAMARQREYDISTAKSIKDLARILMDNGLLNNMAQVEVRSLLAATTNAIGRQDISKQVKRVFDVMLRNHLRNLEMLYGKLLTIRGSKVDARGIQVQGELDPDGQMMINAYKKAVSLPSESYDAEGNLQPDCIAAMIGDALNRMSDPNPQIADNASVEYAGLQFAKAYVDNIKGAGLPRSCFARRSARQRSR